MGIGIYRSADPTQPLSNGDFTSPLTFHGDGRTGQVRELRLYVHNDDATFAFTDIEVQPIDNADPSHVDGTDGWVVKVATGDQEPTQSGWDMRDPGEAQAFENIMLSGVSSLGTYLPFWVRAEIPAGIPVQHVTTARLRLLYDYEVL